MKETTPIICRGMNAILDEPQGNQVFCQMNECIWQGRAMADEKEPWSLEDVLLVLAPVAHHHALGLALVAHATCGALWIRWQAGASLRSSMLRGTRRHGGMILRGRRSDNVDRPYLAESAVLMISSARLYAWVTCHWPSVVCCSNYPQVCEMCYPEEQSAWRAQALREGEDRFDHFMRE